MRTLIPDEDMSAVLESLGKSKEELQELIRHNNLERLENQEEEQVEWLFV